MESGAAHLKHGPYRKPVVTEDRVREVGRPVARDTSPLRTIRESPPRRSATSGKLRENVAAWMSGAGGMMAFYWSAVIVADFVNDWLLVGLLRSFRPIAYVALDVGVWWSLWVMATPLIIALARVLDPRRVGWRRCIAIHLAVTVVAAGAHMLGTAIVFEIIDTSVDTIGDRVSRFTRAFTLSEALTYWGAIGLLYAHMGFVGLRNAEATSTTLPHPWIDRFAVRTGERIRFVPVEDVDWLRADGNYVRLYVDESYHLIRGTFSGTLDRLDPGTFVRIHRSVAVNINRVREVVPWFNGESVAVLEGGKELRISKSYRQALLDQSG